MRMRRIVCGNLESNCYVIYQKEGRDCFIIDPGYNPEKILKFIKENKLKVKGILLTHHHYDHVGAVNKIREMKECPVYLHREDLDMYRDEVDVALEDHDEILLEDEVITVLHTPGHTEGSVCFFSEKSKLAFTGDTIFNVDLGRTDMKDGDPVKMQQSVRNVINRWDNEITIYPGHGDSCNMKFVRKINREFLELL